MQSEGDKNNGAKIGVFWLLLAMLAVAILVLGLFSRFFPSESSTVQCIQQYFWVSIYSFVLLVVAKLLNKLVSKKMDSIAKMKGARFDQTRFAIAKNIVSAAIYVVAFIIIIRLIPGLEDIAFSLLAGAGIVAIVIGFAAKDVASNLLAGIFIAIFQPFRVGDRIYFNNTYGKVEDITLRHTIIKTWENQRVVVPNAKISETTIINYSIGEEKCIETVNIPISYDSDIDKAKKIMIEEVKKHPSFAELSGDAELLKKKETVKVRVVDIAESAIILRLYFWAKDKPTGFRMACDLRESIKKRFDKEGIEIPYPYRTIVYKDAKAKKRSKKK
ncbi:MAG: mechanosensitive ion channel family protein [Candidatus Diapherotrites archaeon]|nr:mechanosensitive ion channel family protein [Candidatus Diapherotrites archaeon]